MKFRIEDLEDLPNATEADLLADIAHAENLLRAANDAAPTKIYEQAQEQEARRAGIQSHIDKLYYALSHLKPAAPPTTGAAAPATPTTGAAPALTAAPQPTPL